MLSRVSMGDGFCSNAVVILCTESFTKEEQELLITALDSKAPFFFIFIFIIVITLLKKKGGLE